MSAYQVEQNYIHPSPGYLENKFTAKCESALTFWFIFFGHLLSMAMKSTILTFLMNLSGFNIYLLKKGIHVQLTQKYGKQLRASQITWLHESSWLTKACLKIVKFYHWNLECDSHLRADLTQRLRLFICVETKSSYRLGSSIASAVFSVNSEQSISGVSMSVEQLCISISHDSKNYFHLANAHIPLEEIEHLRLWKGMSPGKQCQLFPQLLPTYPIHLVHHSI